MIALAWALPLFVAGVALARPIRWLSENLPERLGDSNLPDIVRWSALPTLAAIGTVAFWGIGVGGGLAGGPATLPQGPTGPPNSPIIQQVTPIVDSVTFQVTLSDFAGSQDDTHDSTRIMVDSAGKDFTAPLVDSIMGPQTIDSIRHAFADGASYDFVALYRGVNGGWSDTSQVFQRTVTFSPAKITTLSIVGQTDSSLTRQHVTVHNGLGAIAFQSCRHKNTTGDTATFSWGGAQETASAVYDSLGTNIGDTVSVEVTGLIPGDRYEFGCIAYRGEPNTGSVVYGPIPTAETRAVGTVQAPSDWVLVGQDSGSIAGSGTTASPSLPGPPAEGDVVIVVAGTDATLGTVIGAGIDSGQGYTYLLDEDLTRDVSQAALKVMGPTPDGAVNLTSPSGASRMAYAIQVWRGADATTQDATRVLTENISTGYPDPGSITTVTDDALVVAIGTLDNIDEEDLVTAPAGYTNLLAKDTDEPTNPTTAGATVMMASKVVTTAGAENPAAFSGSGSSPWEAITVALRRDGAAGSPVAPSTPTLQTFIATSDTSKLQMGGSGFTGQNQTHDSTNWRIDNNSDMSSPFYDVTSATDLTAHLATDNANLTAGNTYFGDVRYFASSTGWTARSAIQSVVNTAPPPPGQGGGGPNEPAGMDILRTWEGTTLVPTGWAEWQPNSPVQHSIVADANLPSGNPAFYRHTYPPDDISIHGQGTEFLAASGGWFPNGGPATDSERLYTKFWFRPSANWVGNSVLVNKVMYFSVHEQGVGLRDNIFLLMVGAGDGPLNVGIEIQNIFWCSGSSKRFTSPTTFTRGQWQLVEMLFTHNTVGNADGKIKVWVDGVLAIDEDGSTNGVCHMEFSQSTIDRFLSLKFDAIYGGKGSNILPAAQTQDKDDIYVSGGSR